VALTLTASGWSSTINFWNLVSTATSGTTATLSLPQYASVSSAAPYLLGYQTAGAQATFTVNSFTFQ
jgi:hypothetical protein